MQGSRRQFLTRSAQLGILLGGGVPLLQACGDDDSSSGGEKAGPIADGLEPEAGPLRILNYADYVSPDVIAAFEEQYGVKVEITTFDTDTEAITKLASGAIKADVHHSMAIYSVANLVAGGILQPLNKSYIPNAANVLSAFNDPWYDPGAAYSLPYTYFGTGIGYRSDRISAEEVEAQGWDTIWNATAFKGEVSVLDDEREAFTMAMLRRGITDINTADQATIDQALADLTELIDLVNVKVNIEGYKDIPEGTTTIAQTWSGDLITGANNYLPEGTDASVLGFWHPPAGQYVLTNDAMGVVADAEHPVLAHLYLNFILDNDIAEENFGWVGYLPAITKLDADYLIDAGWVPEHLRNCVPTAEELAQALYIKSLGVDGDAKWAEAWSTFNAGG
ncbi:MAG: spermidine/putrescine ABC transporter substrate-binding protein [Ilumatobacter sp.]|nr:spermidine/putrescine ABC transporter substrate-binding protein [Ilumatobacter sp.]MCB0985468.1 spermidine/putrescine ABC transporter substrate-binding protein [Ilumatobacter sp.]